MRKRGRSTDSQARVLICIVMLAGITVTARPQAAPDFSGVWKQDNDRCEPKRSGDVTLQIEERGPEITVETSISHASLQLRHAVQKYTTDGKVSVSTGVDEEEFHTSVTWKHASLVFMIEELKDGRVLRSKETWLQIENGATLQRIGERADGEKRILFFRRLQSGLK